ncbi:MAG: hypothetical protein JRI94_08185, partial [Deltaproteobacteria bacterium]|nr:hypothetical protein [Deltaproteobacteria bacterium]
MKKLSILILVLFVCVAFAVPAVAKVTMGGKVYVDTMFIKNDEHFQRNSAAVAAVINSLDASRSWFTIDVPGSTRLYGKWTNDAGDVGMHIEIGLRGEEGGAEAVNTRYAYGWWKINPMFKLTVGQQDEVIGPYKAGQSMGVHGKLGTRNDNNMDHTGLRGFGNVGNDRKEGVRLDVKLGEKSNLAVAIFTPNVNAVEGNWNAADEEETLPRIDIVYSVSLGSFSLAPGFSWQSVQYEWDPNDESDFEAWVWSLPVKFAPGGPITVTAEINWGENLGNGNWNIGRYTNIAPNNTMITGAQFDVVNGAVQFADTEFMGFWADLSWKAHPIVTIHFLYGLQQLKNDDRFAQANRWDNTRNAYGVSIPIKVAKGFTIRPEVFFYDYGEHEINGVV